MRADFQPDVIDLAIVSTLRMLNRGKAVVWQGSRMYRTKEGTCIDGDLVGDVVDATLIWFVQHSKANPYKSTWGETAVGIQLLKHKFT
jgi:hypothetical protein